MHSSLPQHKYQMVVCLLDKVVLVTALVGNVENAPTRYRAPPSLDPEFLRKIPKNNPRPEILDSHNLHPKYPENTETIPPKYLGFGKSYLINSETIYDRYRYR